MKTKKYFIKIPAFVAALFLLALSLSSCSTGASYVSDTFFAMDTVIEIKIASGTHDSSLIFHKCRELTRKYEKMLSAEGVSSDIASFNASVSGCEVSAETGELFLLAEKLFWISGGTFDPTTYPAILLWRKAEQTGELPGEDEISEAVKKRGMELISYDPSSGVLSKAEPWVMLDFGGIGKGYAESAVIEYLKTTDAEYGVLSFGGNVSVFGKHPGGSFTIALRDPVNDSSAATVKLSSGFVSVSGGYERYYEIGGNRYCHILDPSSGMPVGGELLSVAVISENGAAADALSTALFVSGSTEAAKELYSLQKKSGFEFEAILIYTNEIYITPGLSGVFDPSAGRAVEILSH